MFLSIMPSIMEPLARLLLNGNTYFLFFSQLLGVDGDSCRALLLLKLDN